jgi:hypothetical protein
MPNKRTKKYLNSVMYFSILWGIKEFIVEPIISKLKDDKVEPKQTRLNKASSRHR